MCVVGGAKLPVASESGRRRPSRVSLLSSLVVKFAARRRGRWAGRPRWLAGCSCIHVIEFDSKYQAVEAANQIQF